MLGSRQTVLRDEDGSPFLLDIGQQFGRLFHSRWSQVPCACLDTTVSLAEVERRGSHISDPCARCITSHCTPLALSLW
jgi:hypothetical protein